MTSGWIEAPIVHRHEWCPGLMTIRLSARLDDFEPGQFVNLTTDVADDSLRRPYSLASAPGAEPEFYVTRVEDGTLTPKLFDLPLGKTVLIERKAQGFFTLEYVPDAAELWLVASGTGLGPFIAMLRSDEPWRRFGKIVVSHGVRGAAELGYRQELLDMSAAHHGQLVYVPVVSRDPDAAGVLHGRVTTNFVSGELEARAGTAVTADRSHLMLCGNPEMIRDMADALQARGLRKHRVRQPGHYTIEKYW
jgi:ferredoxin--NADP+ reductase